MAAYFAEIGDRFGFEPGDAWQRRRRARWRRPTASSWWPRAMASRSPAGDSSGSPTERPRSSGCGCDDDWRGAGLGARLLRHLEDRARALGHAVLRLDTNDTLVEAIAMYERAGYRPIERYNDNPWRGVVREAALKPSGGVSRRAR